MRKPPPLLIGAALLFWGWQTGFLPIAAIIAIVLEGARVTKARWELSDVEFSRIWTFCSLLFLSVAIYAFTANDAPSDVLSMLQDPTLRNQRRAGVASSMAVASFIRWLPMIFFPFLAAETYSTREAVPLQTISLILQRRWKQARKAGLPVPASPGVNIGYPYFVLCLFSASIHPSESTDFFWGLSLLLAWALWPRQATRAGFVKWGFVIAAAVTLAYFGQGGLRLGQQYLGNFNPLMFSNYSRQRFDPSRNHTSIGTVGRIKASGKIVLRVEPKEGSKVPVLLREAVYRTFGGFRGERRDETWYAGGARTDFDLIKGETNGTTWELAATNNVMVPVSIACYLPGGVGLLPLPEDTAKLENLPAFTMQRNPAGAVLAHGPGLLVFDAYHGPGIQFDAAPDQDDRRVPRGETNALEQVITEAGLHGLPLPQAMRTLNMFFQKNFTYSTFLEAPSRGMPIETPVSRFLLHTRQGHCEYFATATVLLLRQLGYPARYAVGYAVHENAGGSKYVVRQRDAHAWCLVWRDGLWRDFDTTPASWFAEEAAAASPFQGLADFWSRIVYEFSRIRYGQTHLRQYLLWGLAGILVILFGQIVFTRRRKRHAAARGADAGAVSWPGLDSEFYRLERRLAARGFPRATGEPLSTWLARSAADPALMPLQPELTALLHLHYRYRFDPLGLRPVDRDLLRARVEASLDRISTLFERASDWPFLKDTFRSRLKKMGGVQHK